ncbi:MAG: hypothetical protein J6S18_04135 [Oscillospiraceae bacterium]|nr:hypothetical protein [Oscillospiraceae bacterium]
MATKKDIDYSELIDQAVAKGDYRTAADLEVKRNEKIKTQGLNYETTNRFGGWLDDTDYGEIGLSQMANGASKDEVKETYYNRYNKAANTEGLTQYADDEIQQAMWEYITADEGRGEDANGKPTFSYGLYQAQNPQPNFEPSYSANIDQLLAEILNRDGFTFDKEAPTFTDNYGQRIESLIGQIQGRDPFSYNAESDPLFQQYQETYTREGNRAMNDTLASLASGAGGMNSYAVTAAQQANNNYMAQLSDRIPELQQLAYEMYMQDFDDQVTELNLLRGLGETEYNRYRDDRNDYLSERNAAYQQYLDDIERQMANMGLLQDMDANQYNRYRDTMSDWRNDRDFAYGAYRDDVGDYKWSEEFGWQKEQDTIGNQQWQDSFEHQKEQAAIGNQQWQQSHNASVSQNASKEAYNKAAEKLDNGVMPTADELKAAGITSAQAQTWLTNGSYEIPDYIYQEQISNLGLDANDAATIDQLFSAGALVEDKNGNVSWADGWNSSNYKTKLNRSNYTGGGGGGTRYTQHLY